MPDCRDRNRQTQEARTERNVCYHCHYGAIPLRSGLWLLCIFHSLACHISWTSETNTSQKKKKKEKPLVCYVFVARFLLAGRSREGWSRRGAIHGP
jgi:hypothetical protein